MLTILLFTLLFLIIWYYSRSREYYKTGDPKENNQIIGCFHMILKIIKIIKYWDKDVQTLNQEKNKNKLIFLLYIDTLILFILTNLIVAKMIFIFN